MQPPPTAPEMSTWTRVRLVMRSVAGVCVPVIGNLAMQRDWIPCLSVSLVFVACSCLSTDLPRDPWPPAKQEAVRQRRATRPNPIRGGGGNDQ